MLGSLVAKRFWHGHEHPEGWSKRDALAPSRSLEGKRLLHPTPPLTWSQSCASGYALLDVQEHTEFLRMLEPYTSQPMRSIRRGRSRLKCEGLVADGAAMGVIFTF